VSSDDAKVHNRHQMMVGVVLCGFIYIVIGLQLAYYSHQFHSTPGVWASGFFALWGALTIVQGVIQP